MKLTGVRLDNPLWESSRRVAEAIVTPERIARDWMENGVRYHLLAHSQDGRLSLTHDRLRGRVAYGGVVVDGVFLNFDRLSELIQTYEGFQFDLKIVDSSDELD